MGIEPPELTWDGDHWTAEVVIPEWAGFLDAQGPYNSGRGSSDGRVRLVFAPDRGDDPLNDGELSLLASFCRVAGATSRAVQAAVERAYPAIRQEWSAQDDGYEAYLPALTSPDVLMRLVGLGTIYVHPLVAGEAPYVGFSMRCSWDVEHGLGVLMHGQRVVEMGGADAAFLPWIAERDAKRQRVTE